MDYILPKSFNKKGAYFDYQALEEAFDFFGLKQDVHIRWTNGTRTWGAWTPKDYEEQPPTIHNTVTGETYRGRRVENTYYTHGITASTWLTKQQLERVIWHELTHAAQCERFDCLEDYLDAYAHFKRSYGYKESPFEVEADAQHISRPFNIVLGNDLQEEGGAIEQAEDDKAGALHAIKLRVNGLALSW